MMHMTASQCILLQPQNLIISSHLSLNREGLWGTTDDFATSFLYFSLFFTLEKKILQPLLPGFELATFQSQVRHSYQQATPAPLLSDRAT